MTEETTNDTAFEAEIAALKKKNSELIEREKKAKLEAATNKQAADDAAEEKARTDNDVKALEAQLTKRYEKEKADLAKKVTDYEAQLNTLLIDNAIKDGLAKHNIPPAFHKSVTAMLKAESELKEGVAVVGDKSLADHITAWTASDEGKVYVSAPANGGAGATGGNTTLGGPMPEKWNFTEYTRMKESNPETAAAYAKKHNQPF